jgi:serine/threonine protein kinase
LQRFAREARATARVDSDFLAQVQEISISADPAFIVSQFIPGPTLAEGVTRPGQITGPEIEALAVGLLAAMDQLAAAGVTHRDIKPANIILGEQGPVLVDLGIAKSDTETTLTVAGAVAGTPSWMSPEQATGTEVGPPADVWAWGRCLTWITQQPASAALPDSLSPWVTQALSDTPASRPTAASLLHTLAPDGAKDFVSARGGRLGGYAVGRRDALTDMLQTPRTLLDPSGNEPTRAYIAAGAAPQGVTPAPAPVTPTPSPPIIVQAPPPRSQAALITAIVVVGVLLIAGIAGAAYFLRPTPQPPATQTVQAPAASPAPTITISTTPRPAPTKTLTTTPAPQPVENEIASVPATEQETMQSIMDSMNAGRWDLIPSLCNPE